MYRTRVDGKRELLCGRKIAARGGGAYQGFRSRKELDGIGLAPVTRTGKQYA